MPGCRSSSPSGRPEFALPAAFLVFSFVGTGSSFLAFSAIAAKRGSQPTRRSKAIYYLGGLTEGAETVASSCSICLFPDCFAWFAWVVRRAVLVDHRDASCLGQFRSSARTDRGRSRDGVNAFAARRHLSILSRTG